jgi:hypothetical protein
MVEGKKSEMLCKALGFLLPRRYQRGMFWAGLLICMAPCMIGIARFLKLQRKGSRRHIENLKKQLVELYLMRANLKQKKWQNS